MKGPNVLIVEDEMLVSLQLEEKLPRMGYNVVGSVTSGEEAVAKVEESPVDLILMDIRLEGAIDGIEAAEQIRARRDISVVYLSAHSDDATLRRAKLTDPSAYLVKPFSDTELRTAIDTALYKCGRIAEIEETVRLVSLPLNTLGGAVIVTGKDGAIRYMNSLAEELTAWRYEDAVGRNVAEVYLLKDEETGSMTDSGVSALLNSDCVSTPGRYTLVSKDSSETRIQQSVMPVNDFSGPLSRVVISFQDIEDETMAYAEWSDYASRLYLAGVLCCSDGEHKKAKSFYERALLILEMNLDADDPKVARVQKCIEEIEERLPQGEEVGLETRSEGI